MKGPIEMSTRFCFTMFIALLVHLSVSGCGQKPAPPLFPNAVATIYSPTNEVQAWVELHRTQQRFAVGPAEIVVDTKSATYRDQKVDFVIEWDVAGAGSTTDNIDLVITSGKRQLFSDRVSFKGGNTVVTSHQGYRIQIDEVPPSAGNE